MDKIYRENFGRNLKYYMAYRDMSRKQLSEKTKIHISSIRDYVNGVCYARADKLERIANALDIPTYKLTEYSDITKTMKIIDDSEDNKLLLEIMIRLSKTSKKEKEYILKTMDMISTNQK